MPMTHRRLASPLFLALLVAWPARAEDEPILAPVQVQANADSLDEQREAATQKTVIGRKELDNLGGTTVGEVLGKLPGIDAGGAGDTMAMRARGMMRDSVRIVVNGEPMSANARQAMTMISRLPSEELERVEIVRGASAEYGGGAPVTVNLVLRKALAKDSFSFKTALGVRDGEPNGSINLVKGGGADGFAWLLPLSVFHHGNVGDKESLRRNDSGGVATLWQVDREHGETPLPGLSFSPRLTWKRGADSLTVAPALVYTDSERRNRMTRHGYADPVAGAGYGLDGSRLDADDGDSRQLRLRIDGETRAAEGKLTGRLALMEGDRATATVRESYDNVGGLTGIDREDLDRSENELAGSVRYDRALGAHLLATSLEYASHRRRDRQTLATTTVYRAEDRQWTAWAQDEWTPATGLTFTGGLRGEAARLEVDGAARDHVRLLPSLAACWEPKEGWVLRSSLGAGFKPPKLEELTDMPVASVSANSPLEPDKRGNPGLRPERSVNFEAVLERYLPGNTGVLGVNLYWRATDDFIERRARLEGARWVERPDNEGDARHWGLELDAKLNAVDWLPKGGTLRAHLTLPKGEVDDRRLGLTRHARETPDYQLSLGYDQSLSAWKGSAGFQIQHYGPVKTDIAGETWAETDPRTLLDIYVTAQMSRALGLRLAVQNLLDSDTDRSQRAWSGIDAWRLDGLDDGKRNVTLTLEGKW